MLKLNNIEVKRMKKKMYAKPEIYMERFELSQHIADCAWELTSSTKENCTAQADPDYLPGFPNLFVDSDHDCVLIPGQNYQEYCYHDGAQGVNGFAS